MNLENIISTITNWVWSPALIVLCLFAGLFFSIQTRFVQLRRIKEMVQLLFQNDKRQKVGVSTFQAFTMAISGRVGTGNIVGVATAIGFGGPGAIFWMWIIAFLGASSAFVESTLAQIYKEEHNGEFRGGPSYYIEKGLKCRWLAIAFAICAILACGFLLPSIQSNSIASAFSTSLNINPLYTGITTAIFIGAVVIGGVKRIANVAQIVAPFMAFIYVLIALIIVVCNISKLPATFALILSSAFGTHQIFGAIIGSTIMWGVKRGIFSNEAGQGTCPIIAAAAKVSHPVKQGLVQAFSVYIDTLLVCTATAIMILSTGMYNVTDESGTVLYAGAASLTSNCITYTQAAVDSILPIGDDFIAISLLFFAFTTIMAYYYYAETSIVYLSKRKNKARTGIWILRGLMIAGILYGSVKEAALAWQLGDIGVGLMAWINIVAILFMFPKAIRTLRDYEKQKHQGIDEPVFDPQKLDIENAEYWNHELQKTHTEVSKEKN